MAVKSNRIMTDITSNTTYHLQEYLRMLETSSEIPRDFTITKWSWVGGKLHAYYTDTYFMYIMQKGMQHFLGFIVTYCNCARKENLMDLYKYKEGTVKCPSSYLSV